MTTLKRYHDSVRALAQAEAHRDMGRTDPLRMTEARREHQEARQAWEDEKRNLLVTITPPTKEPVRTMTELEHTKQRIRELRQTLVRAREDNRTLYAQLAANRETKRTLNKEYDALRQKKKTLKGAQ